MPIRTMTGSEDAGKDNVETVRNYPGHEEGRINHSDTCAQAQSHDISGVRSEFCTDRCYGPMGPLYMKTEYVGKVVRVWERNGYDDSDFLATVWDDETNSFKDVLYATTRGWSYPNSASVDATPDLLARWQEQLQKEAEQRRMRGVQGVVVKGMRVRVVRGRKVPKGTEGEVIWTGSSKYGNRIGIRDDAGNVYWTSSTNAEAVSSS